MLVRSPVAPAAHAAAAHRDAQPPSSARPSPPSPSPLPSAPRASVPPPPSDEPSSQQPSSQQPPSQQPPLMQTPSQTAPASRLPRPTRATPLAAAVRPGDVAVAPTTPLRSDLRADAKRQTRERTDGRADAAATRTPDGFYEELGFRFRKTKRHRSLPPSDGEADAAPADDPARRSAPFPSDRDVREGPTLPAAVWAREASPASPSAGRTRGDRRAADAGATVPDSAGATAAPEPAAARATTAKTRAAAAPTTATSTTMTTTTTALATSTTTATAATAATAAVVATGASAAAPPAAAPRAGKAKRHLPRAKRRATVAFGHVRDLITVRDDVRVAVVARRTTLGRPAMTSTATSPSLPRLAVASLMAQLPSALALGAAAPRRRSSLGLRGKRTSLTTNGLCPPVHASVAPQHYYKHIDMDQPEPVRMRQLLLWNMQRLALDAATAATGTPPSPSSSVVQAHVAVLQQRLIQMMIDKAIKTSWYSRPKTTTTAVPVAAAESTPPASSSAQAAAATTTAPPPPRVVPHPQNAANAARRALLQRQLQQLHDEAATWEQLLADEVERSEQQAAGLPVLDTAAAAAADAVDADAAAASPGAAGSAAAGAAGRPAEGAGPAPALAPEAAAARRAAEDVVIHLDRLHAATHRLDAFGARVGTVCRALGARLADAYTARQKHVLPAAATKDPFDLLRLFTEVKARRPAALPPPAPAPASAAASDDAAAAPSASAPVASLSTAAPAAMV
ncbi:hypothetical protein CXG81DRAFT_19064 [Caulochytrium protostelioides]|uniref:Uncharacterized protein n=1 Tax=Caulochytrium protostelioides TaxID=1555241 RepID=A0A4V1IUM8_9FUNG|nr:hypothetical protein CXG81DRAFT_19064 [Caulochytrium protostelioides]|eukprot:RKP01109.1 hypothetical protein CXG81DRAFT_19064 [Caulochytrium protostelioides]